MKNIITIIAFILLAPSLNAQLVVDETTTPEQALEILLGDGIDVSNITFSGDPEQIGSFDGFNANVGIEEGVILGTGDVSLASGIDFDPVTFDQITGMGGNNSDGGTLGNGNFGANDPDLDQLSTVNTNDAAILEFDFVPTGDSLTFFYVFGSEEYNEFVCGTVNDAFGFFLSGPGINGPFADNAINLALIPDTNIPVTINTVNNGNVGQNGFLDQCESVSPMWDENSAFFIDNSAMTAQVEVVEYDGLTVVLRAYASVICGEDYHIKIAIADGGDTSLDSGVFLQKDSFSSEGVNLFAEFTSAVNDSTAYEGCGNAEIIFERTAGLDSPVDINITYLGSATPGLDYIQMPDILTLDAGESQGILVFETIEDGITEGLESVTFSVDIAACNADSSTFTIYIDDTELTIDATSTTPFCPGDDVTLEATYGGGLPEYLVEWSNGEISDNQVVNPTAPENYVVTVTDDCGNVATADVFAPVPVPAPLTLNMETLFESDCQTDFTLTATASGGIGDYTYLWTEEGINISEDQFYTRFFNNTTQIQVEVGDQCGELTSETINILIGEHDPLIASTSLDTTICWGSTIMLNGDVTGGTESYSFQWLNGPASQNYTVTPLQTQTFTFQVTDGCGLTSSSETQITVNNPQAAFSQSWTGGNSFQFQNESTGASIYDWSFGNGEGSQGEHPAYTYPSLNDFYTVTLTIEDDLGCTDIAQRVITPPLEVYVPNTFTPDYDGINDVFEYVLNGVDEFEMFIFNRWGEQVWYTDTPGEFWDGSVNNGEYFAQDQVYTWLIKVQARNIFSEDITGTVTILR